MDLGTLIHYLLIAIAGASIVLVGLSWLEGALTIWLPRSPDSRFWKLFDKVLSTLRYVSASEEKLSRARFAFRAITKK
jgi:hypothetical protein